MALKKLSRVAGIEGFRNRLYLRGQNEFSVTFLRPLTRQSGSGFANDASPVSVEVLLDQDVQLFFVRAADNSGRPCVHRVEGSIIYRLACGRHVRVIEADSRLFEVVVRVPQYCLCIVDPNGAPDGGGVT